MNYNPTVTYLRGNGVILISVVAACAALDSNRLVEQVQKIEIEQGTFENEFAHGLIAISLKCVHVCHPLVLFLGLV